MSESRIFVLREPQYVERALQTIRETWRAPAIDGAPLEVVIRPHKAKRSIDQNAMFHAICEDIEKSRFPWMGKPRDAAQWKVLLVSGHAVATKQGAEVVPGLEGEFVNIRESTARMGVRRASSLIEYAKAFCAMHDIRLREPEREAA